MIRYYEKPQIIYWTAAELNSIKAKMSGGSGSSIIYGTESNPYLLSDGVAKQINTLDSWFKCDIDGAVMVEVNGGGRKNIQVKNLNAFPTIGLLDDSSTIVNYKKKFGGTINSLINPYTVHVTLNERARITCKISQNIDSVQNSNGGFWISADDSSIPYAGNEKLCGVKWFLPAESVECAAWLIESGKYTTILDNSDDIRQAAEIAGQTGVSALLSVLLADSVWNGPLGLLAGVVMSIICCWVENEIDSNLYTEMRNVGGYDGNTALYPIVVKKYYNSRIFTHIVVERWQDGLTIEGVKGKNGTIVIADENFTTI